MHQKAGIKKLLEQNVKVVGTVLENVTAKRNKSKKNKIFIRLKLYPYEWR